MRTIFHVIGILLIFLTFSWNSYGQKFNPKNRYHSIGVNLGTTNYVGELDPDAAIFSPAFYYTRYNFGVCYVRRYKANISWRINGSYGRIAGDDYKNADYTADDIHRKLRNLSFRNHILEVKADVIYDFIGHHTRFPKRPQYVPYAFLGIAYFHHNPQGQRSNGDWVNLKPLSTEGQGLPGTNKKPYSLHQIAIPVGLGIRYKLGKQWDLAFEAGWRITFTDYLDDVSTSYTDRDLLIEHRGQLAAEMADRTHEAMAKDPELKQFVETRQGGYVNKNNTVYNGNDYAYIRSYNTPGAQRGEKNKDWYVVTGFHLTYILPGRVICPKFRN